MKEYISKEYLNSILSPRISNSRGAEYYAYNVIKQEIERIPSVETFEPHPTEAIVLRFKFDDIPIDELELFFNVAKKAFPDNAIIAMPDKVSLESCSKDVLENYISMIAEIIEEL